ncbi:MAG: DEAD/DEAH box helicase [Spirochaetales bacterium]|nr:DEAD/DEAH box helicase [Spirochaetales bacterium]
MKFTEFSLHEDLQKGIENAGYVECTPVQEQVLKAIIEGRDLYVQSQTGTGKTCAYLTSVIQQLLSRTDVQGKQALVMVPTRELAVQVQEEAEKLCSGSNLKCASFYGGVGYDKQVAALKKGADILIGTPGRVIDLNQGGQMDLANVGFLVIDEADRMFDMGFYPDLRTLIKVLPASEKRQTMLFSATLNSYVKNLAWEYTRDPAEITIAAENITVDEIDQELLHVSSTDKTRLLLGIINSEKPESLIIFCNTKRTCEVIAKRLRINGIETEFIIGDLPQKKRLAIMDKFKAGNVKCLVATDVAARGIDVNDLAMVINYDLPNEAENYVHRIGRTARAGKSGKAYTFCSEQDVYSLPPIERYIEKQIPSRVAEESMMAEDKSKDMYIRTDSYHEEYNDKSEFGRMRQAQYERSGRGKKKSSRGSSRGSGRYSSRNEEAKKEYKRDRRVYNPADDELLASMSSEERMKHYKEKYAGAANSKASGSYSKSNQGKKTNGSYGKKNGKDFKKGNKNNRSSVNSKPIQGKKTNEKKSFFGKLKSLFSKKK